MPSSYSIGEHFERFVEGLVESGRYSSASEVVRDALRLLETNEQVRSESLAEFRAYVREGLNSGRGRPAGEVFDRLEQKYLEKARRKRTA